MFIIRVCLLLTLASASVFAQVNASTLPEPPTGFSWKPLTEIKASFLMPEGWHYKHQTTEGTEAYFITLEDLDKQGSYLTGMSLNCVGEVSKKSNMWVKQYARQLHDQMKKDSSLTVVNEWENPQGSFMVYGMRCEKQMKGGMTIVMHQLLVANEKTDRLYVIVFESTKGFWDAAWRIGDVMMTKFVLDQGV